MSSILMRRLAGDVHGLTAVLLQEVIPDEVRGRVMSLYLMAAGGIMAFANLGFGSMADALGAPILFLVPGAAFTVIVLASRVVGTRLPGRLPDGLVPAA
ncbi:hypothetical protein [Candidatus Amarobacter glycogenicus]|uniref:hypothetical protein n=1 Tax=Candidatus Amarobacter glycogenicus TaxID=3140699 RepID=UPI002A0D344C|nr:MFS transporter [Dehalococcoidia bacterium]